MNGKRPENFPFQLDQIKLVCAITKEIRILISVPAQLVVALLSPVWREIMISWDSLVALYLEELPTGRCPKLYARMKELGC